MRIEDDILMTAEGPVNLSAALPRTADDVEAWMAGIYQEIDAKAISRRRVRRLPSGQRPAQPANERATGFLRWPCLIAAPSC